MARRYRGTVTSPPPECGARTGTLLDHWKGGSTGPILLIYRLFLAAVSFSAYRNISQCFSHFFCPSFEFNGLHATHHWYLVTVDAPPRFAERVTRLPISRYGLPVQRLAWCFSVPPCNFWPPYQYSQCTSTAVQPYLRQSASLAPPVSSSSSSSSTSVYTSRQPLAMPPKTSARGQDDKPDGPATKERPSASSAKMRRNASQTSNNQPREAPTSAPTSAPAPGLSEPTPPTVSSLCSSQTSRVCCNSDRGHFRFLHPASRE